MFSALPDGAALGVPSGGGSAFESDMPEVVYQTSLAAGSQDGSTPLSMPIMLSRAAVTALSSAVRGGATLASLIHTAIRRLDLRDLEEYDPATRTLLGLRLSQTMFEYDLRASSSVLIVHLHRKELPVSTNFGNSPFRLVVLLKPNGEAVVSSPFHVCSKEAPARAPRPPPKRQRAPSSRIPTRGPAVGDEALVSSQLKALKRVCVSAGSPEPEPLPALPATPTKPLSLDALSFTDDILDMNFMEDEAFFGLGEEEGV